MEKRLIVFMNAYTEGMSGGDSCFIEISKRLVQYEKVVITSALGEKICKERRLQAEYIITSKEKKFKNIIFTYLLRSTKALSIRLVLREGDILYGSSDFFPDVFPIWFLKIKNRKIPWVQKIFHFIPKERFISHNAQMISHFFIKRFANLVIVDNALLRDELLNIGFDREKVKVNYPGIDLEYFRKRIIPEIKKYDAIFLGRLHFSKGIFELVKIWKIVCRVKSDARLVIMGSGDDQIKIDLKQKISDAGLNDNILFLGRVDEEEKLEAMAGSKVFVFPSTEEGFGIVILEAMACGLPVIAWDLPVFKEVFPRGMLRIMVGDNLQFSKAVINLLEDKHLSDCMEKEAGLVAQRYDWSRTSDIEMKLLSNL